MPVRPAVLLASLLIVACYNDRDPSLPGTTSATTGSETGQGESTGLSTSGPEATEPALATTSSTTVDPDSTTGPPAGCALDDAMSDCSLCTCYTCSEEYTQCLSQPACKAMDDCFRTTKCSEDECYTVCNAEISAYGGVPLGGPNYKGLAACRFGDCIKQDCGGFYPF